MKLHQVVAVVVAMSLSAAPALAASTTTTPAATATTTAAPATTAKPASSKPAAKTKYYIAQATDTKACSVVTKKPDGKTATMVGKYWYATEAKATAAMKHQAACKSA